MNVHVESENVRVGTLVSVSETATQTEVIGSNPLDLELVEEEYNKAVRVMQLAKFAQKVAACDIYEDDNSDDNDDLECNC